ncbi:flippase-like domain-containing protein [Synechococcus sp. CBW1108]|uniref:flippase-like domain-containing protein n=1 Tax=Synechococcus sp. CBW1108 TaxID=1353147 RepID=UPI0018CF708E|nr:flippase-like domain-containing protein [Synechococcus sp. CBW1108]QPN70355.1 flippase-like domain-containing protein [Synechococcus sp. CBW1108]
MPKPELERIAVFDVDGTLLRGDCLWLAARRSRGLAGQLGAAVACLPWLIGWQLRLVSTGRLKQQVVGAFGLCQAVNLAQSQGRADWQLLELRAQLRPNALERLRWHQQRGDRVLLCSASPRMLLQPLADWLGVELLCTELEQVQGKWRPRLVSPNCKGPEKVRRLAAHLGPLDGLTIEAYGDSKGDRELLQAAALPHYRSFLPEPEPYPPFSLGPLLPVVALALLAYGLLGIWSQGDQLLPLLRSLWPQIALGLLLVLLGYGIRFGRWRLLLQALNQNPPVRADARIWMGSFAFTATPGKSGEAVRSLLLKQEWGVPMAPTLMALVVERLTDGTAVLLLLLINLPLLLRWQVPLAVPIGIGLAMLLAGWLVLGTPWAKCQLKGIAHRLLPRKLASAGGEGLAAMRRLLQPALILQATVVGALAWSLEGVSLWLLLRGMGIEAVGIGGATIAHTAAGLLGALTLLPGGLGSTEAGTVGMLALQGVALAAATPATLLIRLMTLWFATFLGVICLLQLPRRRR